MQITHLAVVHLLGALVTAHPGNHLFERATCNADTCLRAVRSASSQGAADCSSFQSITVSGCGSTTNAIAFRTYTTTEYASTTTLTYYSTGPGGPQKRTAVAADLLKRQASCSTTTINPSYIKPAYTNACKVSSRFASACSCQGITRTTLSVNTADVTYTRTYDSATITQVNTVQTLQPLTPPFQIVLPGGRKLGYGQGRDLMAVASDTGSALVFWIDGLGRLSIYQSAKGEPPKLGIRAYSGTSKAQVFGLNEFPGPEPGVRFKCTLTNPSQGSGNLVCSDGGSLKFPVLCGDTLFYSTTRDQAGCAAIDLYAQRYQF